MSATGDGAAGRAAPPVANISVIGGVPSPNAEGGKPTAWVASVSNTDTGDAGARGVRHLRAGVLSAPPGAPRGAPGGGSLRGVSAIVGPRRGARLSEGLSPRRDHETTRVRLRLRRG